MNKLGIIDFIIYLHQLPQNLLGLLVLLFTNSRKSDDLTYYQSRNPKLRFGVSLGKYIIFGHNCYDLDSWFHEAGHCRQSVYLGWLYLIVVGVPSILRNIWDRLFHKNWSNEDRDNWYYGGGRSNQI